MMAYICLCKAVSSGQIEDSIAEAVDLLPEVGVSINTYNVLDYVIGKTKACTNCATCLPTLEDMIQEVIL